MSIICALFGIWCSIQTPLIERPAKERPRSAEEICEEYDAQAMKRGEQSPCIRLKSANVFQAIPGRAGQRDFLIQNISGGDTYGQGGFTCFVYMPSTEDQAPDAGVDLSVACGQSGPALYFGQD